MSFLDISQSAAGYKEPEALPENEYKVRVSSVTLDEQKGFMILRLEPVDFPYAKDITALLNLPGAGRNDKEENENVGRLIAMYKCFGLDPGKPGGYNLEEELIGREGWIMVGPPMDDGKGYGIQNKLKYNGFLPRR
jgi:hypothetical protein